MEMKLTKVKQMTHKESKTTFIIAKNEYNQYIVYLKDEWTFGKGFRYPEFECGTNIQEAIDFINSY